MTALIFPRLARNFVKDGYFPTDSETLGCIASAINIEGDGLTRIIDPCCGEGSALFELEKHLKQNGRLVSSFGIEINHERAWHAKTVLHQVAHSNIEHVWVSQKSCGLLFLNPPYGDMIRDKGDIASERTLKRFEAHFLERSQDWLQVDGLLVLIVPHYIVDAQFASLIVSYFYSVSIWLAPVQDYKQCVIFGVKRRVKVQPSKREVEQLVTSNKELPVLPAHWSLNAGGRSQYTVPCINQQLAHKFTFKVLEIDEMQLKSELFTRSLLWPQLQSHFATHGQQAVRPLMPMSQWHLALALVSGQVNGYIEGKDGSRYLVKGSTHKTKQKTVMTDDSGREEVVMTDRFEPRIMGFNLTPGPLFGSVIQVVNRLDEVSDAVVDADSGVDTEERLESADLVEA